MRRVPRSGSRTETGQPGGQRGRGGGPGDGGGGGEAGGQACWGHGGHVADHRRGPWAKVDEVVLCGLAQNLGGRKERPSGWESSEVSAAGVGGGGSGFMEGRDGCWGGGEWMEVLRGRSSFVGSKEGRGCARKLCIGFNLRTTTTAMTTSLDMHLHMQSGRPISFPSADTWHDSKPQICFYINKTQWTRGSNRTPRHMVRKKI